MATPKPYFAIAIANYSNGIKQYRRLGATLRQLYIDHWWCSTFGFYNKTPTPIESHKHKWNRTCDIRCCNQPNSVITNIGYYVKKHLYSFIHQFSHLKKVVSFLVRTCIQLHFGFSFVSSEFSFLKGKMNEWSTQKTDNKLAKMPSYIVHWTFDKEKLLWRSM